MKFSSLSESTPEKFDVKIYVKTVSDPEVSVPDRVSGIYFGAESCAELMPDAELASSAFSRVRDAGLTFHLLSPAMLVESGLTLLAETFSRLDEAAGARGESVEVICNDWGAFTAASSFEAIEPVLGRYLNSQRTDPRIGDLACRHIPSGPDEPEPTGSRDDRFEPGSLNVSLPWMERFLTSHGAGRVEISPVPEGWRAPPGGGIRLSLYYPFIPVAVTRFCQVRDLLAPKRTPNTGVFPCNRECRAGSFRISHGSINEELTLFGNAVFRRSDILDTHGPVFEDLPGAADRLVLFDEPA